jgi:hypothetical protein
MPESLDPAARLHGLLAYCKHDASQSSRIGRQWATYFDLEEDSVAYIQALAQVALLPGEVRSAFEGLRASGATAPFDFLLEPLPDIEEAIFIGVGNQSSQLSGFSGRYTDTHVALVAAASATLKAHAGPPADATDLLDTVAATADDLSALLADDDTLEPDVRTLLYTLADGLRRTAQTFKMTGSEGIAQERDLLIGRLSANPGLQRNVRRHSNVVALLVRFLTGTERAASFYNTAVEAGDGVQGMIQSITAG